MPVCLWVVGIWTGLVLWTTGHNEDDWFRFIKLLAYVPTYIPVMQLGVASGLSRSLLYYFCLGQVPDMFILYRGIFVVCLFCSFCG